MTKVYVVYMVDYYEGCSQPLGAFATKKLAEQYISEQDRRYDYDFEEMEIIND